MSNLAFITTPKFIKSYDMYSLLMDINYDRFGKNLSVMSNPPDGWWKIDWIASDLSSTDGFDIHIHSKRKLSIAWPVHSWTVYMSIVFKHELAKKLDGHLSDESDDKIYQPNPEKYSSYRKWLEIRFDFIDDEKILKKRIEQELEFVPLGMEKF